MNHHFEIVRRAYGSFSWLLVNPKGRVVARSESDWRSKKRVGEAIDRLRETVDEAEVVDATNDPSSLPTTSFALAPDVLPLLVGEPAEYLTAASATGQRRDRSPKRGSKASNRKSFQALERAQRASAGTAGSSAVTEEGSPNKAPADKATAGATAKASPSSGTRQRTPRRQTGAKKAADSDAGKANPGSATDQRRRSRRDAG
jgi:uncharacterized protein YegP (UPF0339 family)